MFFVVWFTDERYLALLPVGTTARDPHYRESPTRRERIYLSESFVEWSCEVVITTTPRHHGTYVLLKQTKIVKFFLLFSTYNSNNLNLFPLITKIFDIPKIQTNNFCSSKIPLRDGSVTGPKYRENCPCCHNIKEVSKFKFIKSDWEL